ncbi:MAG: hypothetical protein BWK76_21020 [Desulfobulbaceae bacterium A2]|nr:MAG: hypothetical protein BWK76_21020 [Desulfobulbaceae bacterium A2]
MLNAGDRWWSLRVLNAGGGRGRRLMRFHPGRGSWWRAPVIVAIVTWTRCYPVMPQPRHAAAAARNVAATSRPGQHSSGQTQNKTNNRSTPQLPQHVDTSSELNSIRPREQDYPGLLESFALSPSALR